MPQLSLYLDDATMAGLRDDAQRAGTSLSSYAAGIIRRSHASAWPEGFFDLYGSIRDDSFDAPDEMPWTEASCGFDDFAFRE